MSLHFLHKNPSGQAAMPPSIYRPSRYAGALLYPSGEIDLEV